MENKLNPQGSINPMKGRNGKVYPIVTNDAKAVNAKLMPAALIIAVPNVANQTL